MRIIGGHFKGKPLQTPKGHVTRPTLSQLREAVFNICQNEIEEASFLDLFAGSGAMGLEGLSRGARFATFVEQDKFALSCIKKNLDSLNLTEKSKVIAKDVLTFLRQALKEPLSFDIIYIDPPYGSLSSPNPTKTRKTSAFGANPEPSAQESPSFLIEEILHLIDQSSLLAKKGTLFVEEIQLGRLEKGSLKTLTLISTRKMGRSWLYQYKKSSS